MAIVSNSWHGASQGLDHWSEEAKMESIESLDISLVPGISSGRRFNLSMLKYCSWEVCMPIVYYHS